MQKYFYLLFIVFPAFLMAEKEVQQKGEYNFRKNESSITSQEIKLPGSNSEVKLDGKKSLAYKETKDNKNSGIHVNRSGILDIAQIIFYVVISFTSIYLLWKDRTSAYRGTLYSLQLKGYSSLASLMKKIILYIETYPYVVQKAKEEINKLNKENRSLEERMQKLNNKYKNPEEFEEMKIKIDNLKREVGKLKKEVVEKTMQCFFEEDFNMQKGKRLFLDLFNKNEAILPEELAEQFQEFFKEIPYNNSSIPYGEKLEELKASIEKVENGVYKVAEEHFNIKVLTQATRKLIEKIEISREVEKIKADQSRS